MKNTTARILMAAALVSSAGLLAACSEYSAEEAGRRIDQATADAKKEVKEVDKTVDAKTDQVFDAVKEAGTEAKMAAQHAAADATQAMKDSAGSVKDAAKETADAATRAARDGAITASIKVDLAKDPGLSAFAINVDTTDGAVTLRGDVKTLEAKQRAGNIARNIVGVTRVTNELRVKA